MTSTAPTMRQFFATAHALNLQAHKGDYSDHAIKNQENLELFEAVEQLQRLAGTFDPWAIVDKTGLPFVQALLRAKDVLPVAWVAGWAQRNGLETVFQGAAGDDEQPLVYWMEQRLLPSLDQHLSKQSVDMARWLAEHSPWWDPARASLWVEKLKAVPPNIASQVGSLLDLIVSRGIQVADPSRCPERWWDANQVRAFMEKMRAGQADAALLDREVLCPSGQRRSLGELWALRLGLDELSDYHPVADPSLPELPHKRRDALAKEWVLDPDIDLQVARARLWACMQEKPEVFSVLVSTHDAAPDSARANRIAQIMSARDKQGRTFSAFLSLSKVSWAIADLTRRGWAGVMDMERDGDNAGLVEQCLADLVGVVGTTFRLSSDRILDDIALGPSERFDTWVDMLVDRYAFSSNRWGGVGQVGRIAQAMPDCPAKSRLSEAVAFNNLSRALLVGAGASYVDAKQGKNFNHTFASDHHPVLAEFAEHCATRDLALDVGQEEWRQWGVMLSRQDWLESKPSWLSANSHKVVVDLCHILDARTLERDLSRAPMAAPVSTRRGHRL